jgi:hypothetical protein
MRRAIFFWIFISVFTWGVALAADTPPIKVGFVFVSPIGDAGWSYAHNQGRLSIEAMDGVTTSFVEAVPEGPDSERVMLNMARKNYNLIFATSYGYMDPMLKVAKQFPDIVFMHCSGFKTAKNMGNYFGRMYQARYLSGMVAGAMTKSKILGYVAAFPIPEVIRVSMPLRSAHSLLILMSRFVWFGPKPGTTRQLKKKLPKVFWMLGRMSSPSIRIRRLHRKPLRKKVSTRWGTIPICLNLPPNPIFAHPYGTGVHSTRKW